MFNEMCYGSVRMISEGGVFNEICYGSVRKVSETV